LVIGQQDLRRLRGETKSAKLRKAESLVDAGHDIEVIGEAEFLKMLEPPHS